MPTPEDRQQQSSFDRAEIKVRLIKNGVLVKWASDGWYTFPDWNSASAHIGSRLGALRAKQAEQAA